MTDVEAETIALRSPVCRVAVTERIEQQARSAASAKRTMFSGSVALLRIMRLASVIVDSGERRSCATTPGSSWRNSSYEAGRSL
jgi:hypothetical protein